MLGRCARLLLFSAAIALLSAATARASHVQADAALLDPRLSTSAAESAERLASLYSDHAAAEHPLACDAAAAATPALVAMPLTRVGELETELVGAHRIEQLLGAEPRRGPPSRIAETRIGGLELPGKARIEGDAELTDSTQRGCGSSWLERASGFAFEVEADHSYLVKVGDDGPAVWVHNAGIRLPKKFPRWKVKDSITRLTRDRRYPTWKEIRERYWKNRALEATERFSPANLSNMRRGRGPKARIFARMRETGELRVIPVTKELHHARGNRGVPSFDDPFSLREVWPWEHEKLLPPGRKLDYDFEGFVPRMPK